MLTVFTPTYNRAYTLSRAYEALCRQTCQNFLWLIVDDGSTDDTESLVKTWIQEGKISIQYHKQLNHGKMYAHNRGVELCHTELFVCIDSDDYLVQDAVENILNEWKSLENKEHIAGIVAYKGKDSSHTLSDGVFPTTEPSTLQELYENGFTGDAALVHRTDILSLYPFPEFEGETFIPEAVSYDRIDRHCPLHVFPKILVICEYLNDGLTQAIDALRKNNPKGWLLYYQQRIKYSRFSVLRYKYIAHAICFCWELKQNPLQHIPAPKAEICGAFPGACLLRIIGKL
ncbi:MAG: glycosyltransferase family 2 protein [Hungatella sp.]|nr:glycosyltransferase family 2 protein [Hungatella sp.]